MTTASKYEISGVGAAVIADSLRAARLIARRKAKINYERGTQSFVLINQINRPCDPTSRITLVEKWRMNRYGDYEQNRIVKG